MTSTDTTVTRTDDPVANLLDACKDAKRQQQIVNVPCRKASLWDEHHEWLNVLLDELDEARK